MTMTEPASPRDAAAPRPPAPDPLLPARLAGWVAEGLITAEQARRIEAREAGAVDRGRTARASLLVEGLGYLGGVVVVVAALLLAGNVWNDLGLAGRLLVVGSAAVLMVLAGAVVPASAVDAGRRLRAVLWAGAVVAWAGFVGTLAGEAWSLEPARASLTTAAGSAVLAVALWLARPTQLQHLTAVVTVAVTGAAVVGQFDDTGRLIGLGVWTVGLAWCALAQAGVIRPTRLGTVLGAGTAVVGGLMSMQTDAGTALGLVTAVLVIALALGLRELMVLATGAVGLLVALPLAVDRWFGGSLAVPFALLVAGLMLVAAALWIARGRAEPREEHRDEKRDHHVVQHRHA